MQCTGSVHVYRLRILEPLRLQYMCMYMYFIYNSPLKPPVSVLVGVVVVGEAGGRKHHYNMHATGIHTCTMYM